MRIHQIHSRWGDIWYLTKEELFSLDPAEFRKKIYDRRLVIIKSVGTLSNIEIFWLMQNFGKPWEEQQYVNSRETFITDYNKNQKYVLTKFSTSTTNKIGLGEMPWHSDIPNNRFNPFPIRFLYMNIHPNNEYGQTRWLNIDLDILNLDQHKLEYFNKCSVIQQSWHRPGTENQKLSFVKNHMFIPNRKSLRLNYFVKNNGMSKDAWILKSLYNDKEISNETLIGDTIDELLYRPELYYQHIWDIGDIAIYDNWSFIHGRTKLVIHPGEEREFIRANIDHLTDRQFNNKTAFIL